MRTERAPVLHSRWCLLCAAALAAQIALLGSLPFEIAQPWNTAWTVLAYCGLTLLMWIATDGRFPVLVVALVMGFGAIDELRQASIPNRSADALDFLVVLAAAVLTAGTLMFATGSKAKPCAESSQR